MSPFTTSAEDIDDPDDELMEETPPFVVEALGFDPLDLVFSQDANLITADPADSLPEVLRKALASEIDAANLYERMADQTDDEEVRRVLLSVAREEKTHFGEFQALLLKIDPDQLAQMVAGANEVRDGQ